MHSIREEYQSRLALATGNVTKEFGLKRRLLAVLGVCALLMLVALVSGIPKLIVPLFVVTCVLVWQHRRTRKRWLKAGREEQFFERGSARLDGQWHLFEETGDEYRRDSHVYQGDLNIFGAHSLFQFLCTARTRLGAECLAELLLNPDSSKGLARQSSVRELVPRTDLREATAFLGDTGIQDCSMDDLRAWLAMPLLNVPASLCYLLSACALLAVLLLIGVYSKALSWHTCWPWIVGLSTPPLLSAGWYRAAVIQRLMVLRPLSTAFKLVLEGVSLLEQQNFHTDLLRGCVDTLRHGHASVNLRQLMRIFGWLEQREKPYFYFTMFVALGTLVVFHAERWRQRHGAALEHWLEAWGMFEALQSLACCAYERPEWAFPDFRQVETCFEALGLGHPLLPEASCVRNDLFLGASQRYLFVSGSNMAGKSTLLRAIGLNAVLAYAGGPVCASSLSLSPMRIYASVAVKDDLSSGTSRFMAEVCRIASLMAACREGQSVLFLIDENFSGTNSQDRRFVASAFLKRVLGGNAVGVLTSHDLSLVRDLADSSVWHMASSDPDEPLRFDYKLTRGLSEVASGVALARLAGVLD